MIETLIVDWDGAIVESSAAVINAYREVTGQILGVQHPSTPGDEVLALNAPAGAVLELWAAGLGSIDTLISAFDSAYGTWATRDVALRHGAADFLDRLPVVGARIIVVSAKSVHMIGVDRLMSGLVGPGYQVVGNVDAWGMGREPKDLRTLCAQHAVRPQTSAFLCNDPRDVIEARAAGIAAVVVLSGRDIDQRLLDERPEHVLSALSEVFDVLLG